MKTIILFAAILVLNFLLYYFGGPWYLTAVISAIACGLIPTNALKSFAVSFAAVFILWLAVTYFISNANNHVFAKKMAAVLPLKGNEILLMVVAAFVGALVSGLGGISGYFARASSK
jgi:hypothetical protein